MSTHVPPEWPRAIDVLAVDLDVRERSNGEAYAAISAVAHLTDARMFVKIDSTLRGPIAGLVSGALDTSGRHQAVVAPAFPEQGRVVRGQRVYVHGEPGASVRDVLGENARCLIMNAETADDLHRVAEDAQAHPDWLLVGSAGLARQLAPPHARVQVRLATDGPVLVVAGSPTSVTRNQLARLAGLDDVIEMTTPPASTRDHGEAAQALAETVADAADRLTPRAVILTGGATARAVIQRLGATGLRILGELEPGVPLGQFADGLWRGVSVVTKAGGFGTPETLLDVVRALGVSSVRC